MPANSLFLFLAARLDWGFGNPNKTAALIAMLMVGVWGIPLIQRHLFWIALALFTGLGVCLLQTASRGGLLATLTGLACLGLWAPRPCGRVYIVSLILAVWTIIGASVWLEATDRFGQGIGSEDKSISHRLEIWGVAPRMMADAPGGWGIGNSGTAFVQWYQPLDRTEEYRTLVNSHLTWLVEVGWTERFLYVFAWGAVLMLCWPNSSEQNSSRSVSFAIAFSIWVVFAISAWFSSVAESLWLWILPVTSLAGVLAWRWYVWRWPLLWGWHVLGLGSCMVLCGFLMIGTFTVKQARIHRVGTRVIVGDERDPKIWVLTNTEILGENYGRILRQYVLKTISSKPRHDVSIGFVKTANDLRASNVHTDVLVVAGVLDAQQLSQIRLLSPRYAKLVLLNPGFYPQDLETSSGAIAHVEVFAGEFSQAPASVWAEEMKRPVQSIIGAGEFLPHWPQLVLTN